MLMKKTALFLTGVFLLMSIYAICKDKDVNNIQMIYVKGANFYMGCDDPAYHDDKYANERPLHRVHIGSYYIGKYEVTNGEWRAVMGIYPPAYNGVDYGNKTCDDCPVVKVSWDDVQEFIRRLNKKTGKTYRLPTETEWEYASRGGNYTKNYKYSGSNTLNEVGWWGKRNGATHPVGTKKPNELSIYDMSGNAIEWCEDWYGEDYYSGVIDATDPKGPEKGTQRVVRGGSFFTDDDPCRSVFRSFFVPDTRQWDLGFRLAMDY
jgi:sulfatase modifying factor 1